MAISTNYTLAVSEAGVLTVQLVPPTNVSGWSVEYSLMKRFGSLSGYITGSCASGYNGVSGITVMNGEAGIFRITNYPPQMSGKLPGNYAWTLNRTDSGFYTELANGWREANNY